MSALTFETSDNTFELESPLSVEDQELRLPAEIKKFISGIDPAAVEILKRTYNKLLESPKIIQTESSKVAIVWRGVKGKRLVPMVQHQSAGGIPANPNAAPPTDQAAKVHVSEGESVPEFTFNPRIAERFGRRGFVACFAIDMKYLAQGSIAEDGVVCERDAPVRLLAWREAEVLPPHVEIYRLQQSACTNLNLQPPTRRKNSISVKKAESKF